MQGQFSDRSNVFSFGVLLLEIMSGRRNTSFCHDEQSWCLLEYASFFSFLLASLPQHIKLHLFVSNLSLGCFNFFSGMETME